MRLTVTALLLAAMAAQCSAAVQKPGDLRLIPFPKQIVLRPGTLTLKSRARILVSADTAARQLAGDLKQDLSAVGVRSREPEPIAKREAGSACVLILTSGWVAPKTVEKALGKLPEHPESYRISINKAYSAVASKTTSGLVWGIQCLRQMVRSNSTGRSIPCAGITDWPSLRYRGFQDDITRGPSPLLTSLQREVRTGSYLRMNFLTYYLEHQFAFKKHPVIGPESGCLLPEELSALVALSKRFGVEIVGCQQSFGHWGTILRNQEFEKLRETPAILNPALEESYQLLDDLYSEQIPLLDCKLFNVCCDEVDGLGTGPSKPLADQIGVGGLYARHMKRVHDLVTGKYGKRMMMWGDIALQHPESLKDIPKDVIMLSWGYDARESFEPAIKPFADAGYEFFVCPGTNCWGRMIPDFGTAVTNTGNYVRDGAKLGALGMLMTTWADDGETLFPHNWHGIAWGAECAWNASSTSIEDFSRRVGGVLFGERGDHFGKAIELLSKCHSMPGYDALADGRFWQLDNGDLSVSSETAKNQAAAMLAIVAPALDHLLAAKKDARFNSDQLDYFIFAAQRIKLMATRRLDFLAAAEFYAKAPQETDQAAAIKRLDDSIGVLQALRDLHTESRDRFRELWLRENKPYALDWTIARFDELIKQYDDTAKAVAMAKDAFSLGGALPAPSEVGLQIVEQGVRRAEPTAIQNQPLSLGVSWTQPACPKRVGIVVESGDSDRRDMPIELDVPAEVAPGAVLVEIDKAGRQTNTPCQIDPMGTGKRLAFIVSGDTSKGARRQYLLYFGADGPSQALPAAVTVKDAPDGMKWVENGAVRLLIGPEGGHIYRWEISALSNLDITEPGEKDWQGFADINGPYRNAVNNIEVISDGPVLARVRCADPSGLEKTFSVWSGMPWVEVNLSSATSWFACYDDVRVMGADSATPGTYMFANGETGPIHKLTGDPSSQVRQTGVRWGAKFAKRGPMIAMITPEVIVRHFVGPGAGMGAVGIDAGAAAHFVIYGGKCPDLPKETLDLLRDTLDLRRQPVVTVYAVEERK